jgi:hypothetical protein
VFAVHQVDGANCYAKMEYNNLKFRCCGGSGPEGTIDYQNCGGIVPATASRAENETGIYLAWHLERQ